MPHVGLEVNTTVFAVGDGEWLEWSGGLVAVPHMGLEMYTCPAQWWAVGCYKLAGVVVRGWGNLGR